MRSHAKIIDDVPGGARGLHERLGDSIHTVRSWRQRNSIPAEKWVTLTALNLASLEELAAGAALHRARADA